ncbi:multidrug effflux MFS transporter [Celeribacter marinus]|uniref:MFS family multidrug efflux protein, similarity to bicyclomycin resistance protein Bcr n=1 Tax=Celeribacter marinus TaxID=1397108 RepID=A0A0P0A8Q9_9RHOB|nr:multidrug effflux MFS transporter [Celeribacter marinus]ALI54370.1 MFS family multidrug efflux protein, similarity to bicyclomycin resistance protein Bcr [Celeribacter marinus]SFK36792.1 MFS transporter, DHA1 family, bicyclomycin/chloramphenicol resistance protein [Celeribacter marinus]
MPRKLAQPEFVALMAMLTATVALSVDSMLPGIPLIAAELTPDDVNRAQLVLTAFVLGLGIGTLINGPLSDRFGRKAVIIGGLSVYAAAAVLAATAPTLETLLAARVIQGLGAAAPRVVTMALIRDLYKGREMARISSFIMMIFILVPAVAPALGALIMLGFGWRGIFGSFVVFAALSGLWLIIRQEETLPKAERRALSMATLIAGTKETFSHRSVQIYTLVLMLGFGQMFGLLSSIQQIYGEVFDKTDSFPIWFAAQALISGVGTLMNAKYVVRLGMRRIALSAYIGQIAISSVVLVLIGSGLLPDALAFPVFFIWSVSVFFMAGVTFGNIIALSLERLGHVAGIASSLVQGISTISAVLIAAPIGLAFNGTVIPLTLGTLICSLIAYLLLRRTVDAEV